MHENVTPVLPERGSETWEQVKSENRASLEALNGLGLESGITMNLTAASVSGTYVKNYDFLITRKWDAANGDRYIGGVNGEVMNFTTYLSMREQSAVDYVPKKHVQDEFDDPEEAV